MAKRTKTTAAERTMRSVVEIAFYKATSFKHVIPMMAIPALYRAGEEAFKACAMLPLSAEETAEIVLARMTTEVEKVAVTR